MFALSPSRIGIQLYLFFTLIFIGFAHAKPPVPVIFIHGLVGDASSWADFGTTLVEKSGWTFGGCPIFNKNTVNNICGSTISAGDFYRLQFSDNQNLTFYKQAKELE